MLLSGQRFCSHCNAALDAHETRPLVAPRDYTCPLCGAVQTLEFGQRVCVSCKQRIDISLTSSPNLIDKSRPVSVVPPTSSSAGAASLQERWEYKHYYAAIHETDLWTSGPNPGRLLSQANDAGRTTAAQVDDFGGEGWELVSVVPLARGGTTHYILYIFKRRLR
jgi:hypothetical protein